LLAASPALGVGIDMSPEMLRVARAKSSIRGRLVEADCLTLPLRDAAFDLAICSFALEHIGNFSELARECWRVMGEPADLYISELHPAAYGAGWRTGFRDQQGALQIETASHSSAEIITEFSRAGFELAQALECFIGDPERPIFVQAGKESYFNNACVVPAVMILHFRRAPKTQVAQ
jgi:ubiquinone/menaquinone biosynthesis C-methylase UbiE